MIELSEKRFRAGVAIALVLHIAWLLTYWFPVFPVSQDAAVLIGWSGLDSPLPLPVVFWIHQALAVLTIIALIGCLFFLKPFRWVLGVVICSEFFVGMFQGLWVLEPQVGVIGSASFLVECWVVFACFWTPIAERFAYQPEDIWMRRIKGA